MAAINTYASLKRALGLAKEPNTAVGTPVAPVAWLPIDKLDWNDKVTWLEDKALRSVMGNESFNVIQGVMLCEVDISGPVFGDEIGYLIGNAFGDYYATGTTTAPTGTLSSASIVGATSVSSSVSIPNGTLIQIDTGVNSECVTTSGAPTGAGPYAIPVPALAKAHNSGVAITAIAAPYTHVFNLLNTLQGQPTTHTLTQFYGPATSTNARQFAGFCVSEIGLTWNAETEMVMYTAKGTAWVSNIAAAAPTPTFTAVQPIAGWRSQLGVGGTVGGAPVLSTSKGAINIKRALKPYFTAQNSQNPYIIQRGGLSEDFALTYIAADESALLNMRNNTQPQIQYLVTNGLSGANLVSLQADLQQGAYTEAKPNFGEEAIQFDVTGKAVFNSTNVGFSGGLGPGRITLVNAVTPNSYI